MGRTSGETGLGSGSGYIYIYTRSRRPCSRSPRHTTTCPSSHTSLRITMESTTSISDNWSYTQLTPTRIPEGSKASTVEQKEDGWHSVSKFPTGIHVELMKRDVIPDHCKGLNEWDVQVRTFSQSPDGKVISLIVWLCPLLSGSVNPIGDSRPRSRSPRSRSSRITSTLFSRVWILFVTSRSYVPRAAVTS